jgi:hypothetical protein
MHFFMPEPRLVDRPTPPQPNTADYDRWTKWQAISWDGGSFSATWGNLVQTWNLDTLNYICQESKEITVSKSSHQRVNKIGSSPTTVAGTTYTQTVYPKKNSSLAAAGEIVRIVTDIGEYSGRLTGPMELFAKFACANVSSQFGSMTIYSPRGASYGPISAAGIQVP